MYAISGYIDNNAVVVNENISSYEGRTVIVTILDGLKDSHPALHTVVEKQREAARQLAGLWKSHDNQLTVEEEVRAIRRGRKLDI